MINYFLKVNKSDFQNYLDKIKDITENKSIGVIDWWHCEDSFFTLEYLKLFLEKHDIILFYSEHTLQKYNSIHNLGEISTLLLDYNVYYVLHCNNLKFFLPKDHKRRFITPAFGNSYNSSFISTNFVDSMGYEDKDYTFSMLLGKQRGERDLLYRSFVNNPNFYITYRGSDKFNRVEIDLEEDVVRKKWEDVYLSDSITTSTKNIKLDEKHYCLKTVIPSKIFNKSHFSIVSEPRYNAGEHYCTTNIGNQFFTSRFFLWWSSSELSDYLSRFGFEFEAWRPWIDYDYIEDDVKRFSKLVDTVDEINQSTSLQQEIYKKTKVSRRNNRFVYMNIVRDYDEHLIKWLRQSISNFTKKANLL